MSILAWIEDQRKLKLLNAPKYNHPASDGSKGLWTRCDHCGVILYIKHLKENRRVCFGCGYHLQMNSQERIDHLIDVGTWRSLDETLSPCDPLEFWDQKAYIERLKESQERTGLQDAVQTGTGMLYDIPIALGVMDFYFMGGSMGSVVGEKITRLIEYASQEGLTLILVCASGGARMQEGVLSLMQMAKISAALQIYQSCANLLYISILTSPTTGGVTASFAMLGDLIFAEPKALIGFAGRRVIEQTLQEQLPEDFQTSEYLLHHGLLDLIIPRSFFKSALLETITLYKDAPLKRSGNIPYGIQQNLNFITEEKIRRKWSNWKQVTKSSLAGYKENCLEKFNFIYKTKTDASKTKSDSCSDNQKIENSIKTIGLASSLLNVPTSIEFQERNAPVGIETTVSESLYREILVSFQAMLEFFSLPISKDENLINNQIFTDKNFDKFIYQSQKISTKKNFRGTVEPSREKLNFKFEKPAFKKTVFDNDGTVQDEPTNFVSSYFDIPSSKINQEIVEWRILYATQHKDEKKNFLQTFINGRHKNFFYKSVI